MKLPEHLAVPRTPLYPPLISAAFVLFAYSASNVSLEALFRPLAVAIAVTILFQVALSAVLRDKDRAAFVTLMLQFLLFGLGVLSLVFAAWLLVAVIVAVHRGRGLKLMPWLRATRVLNAVAMVILAQVVVTSGIDGAFVYGGQGWSEPRGVAAADAPDVT